MQSSSESLLEEALALGLLKEEYERIVSVMNRHPNLTELNIYGVMWSEHCSYKNSILWLKKLPKEGKHLLSKAGEENAGLIDIGDGIACVFKIESHNHPSAIAPYQGAATGVGGINRDIFTMGARPIAQMNSLRFGNPKHEKTKWLLEGIVKGIADYGNAFGVPTVSGEVYFDDCYDTNPLVNAFSLGIVAKDRIVSAKASGVGNPVYIVGALTGKDGINGASFASKDLDENSEEDIPAVQVGDPFQEKLLLEATLELAQTDCIVGMQDMGAAGIICSTSEMSAAGNCGMSIELSKVPTRQAGMKPYEILLSESQERMLIVVRKGHEKTLEAIFEKWDVAAAPIGEITEEPVLRFFSSGKLIAQVAPESLVLGGGAPQYERAYREPKYYAAYQQFNLSEVPEPKASELKSLTQKIIALPNVCSKRWIYEQYDATVGTVNVGAQEPSDAAVVLLKKTGKGLAMSVDCNSRYVHADPHQGAAIAVAENARNIACTGATPLGITNCLNFGNPYDPEVYWQFVHAIKGMSEACETFETPVTGGNVSFYNQTTTEQGTQPVFPTPTIAMVGVLDRVEDHISLHFKAPGDRIFLLGKVVEDLASSQYLVHVLHIEAAPAPYFDLREEKALHDLVRSLAQAKAIASAHDVSEGGLITTLLEKSFLKGFGFEVASKAGIRKDAFWFGEAQGRIVVSVGEQQASAFREAIATTEVPVFFLGTVCPKGDLTLDGDAFGKSSDYQTLTEGSLTEGPHSGFIL